MAIVTVGYCYSKTDGRRDRKKETWQRWEGREGEKTCVRRWCPFRSRYSLFFRNRRVVLFVLSSVLSFRSFWRSWRQEFRCQLWMCWLLVERWQAWLRLCRRLSWPLIWRRGHCRFWFLFSFWWWSCRIHLVRLRRGRLQCQRNGGGIKWFPCKTVSAILAEREHFLRSGCRTVLLVSLFLLV